MSFQSEKFIVVASEPIRAFAERVVAGVRAFGGNVEFTTAEMTQFADLSHDVFIPINVRRHNVYLMHAFSNPNDGYMELFLLNDAIKRASAREIVNVVPYLPYTRKDRKDRPRVPIAAKLFAQLAEVSGANRVITNDLHAGQIQGFYDIPVDNLEAEPIIAAFLAKRYARLLSNLVVVAPDVGASKIARSLARRLDTDMAVIDKRRVGNNEAEVMNVIGSVDGKHCLMFDDMIDSGGTIYNGARALKAHGALEVYAACTHALFSQKGKQTVEARLLSEVAELVVTDSIPRTFESQRVQLVSLAELYAEAIYRTQIGKSLSELFD